MGTWGTGIFSDDLASDIREEFRELVGEGLSPEQATSKLVKDYAPADDTIDLEPIFWLALAVTQYKLGRLTEDTKNAAADIIDSGRDLQRWKDDPKLLRKRKAVLDDVREMLMLPQPKVKKIKPRVLHANNWPQGSIVSFTTQSGRLCLFEVRGHHEDKGGKYAKLDLLSWNRNEMPSRLRAWLLTPALDKIANGRSTMMLVEEKAWADRFRLTSFQRSGWFDLFHKERLSDPIYIVMSAQLEHHLGVHFGVH